MLWTIAVVLVILWLLGLVTGYTMGYFIHNSTGHCNRCGGDRSHSGAKTWINDLPILNAPG
jgi:Family of unknown function (DUF5670)